MAERRQTPEEPRLSAPAEHVTTVSFKHKVSGGQVMLCEAVFVPRGTALVAPKVQEIVDKAWGKTLPNLLVQCEAGSAHPKTLSTEALLGLPQFCEWTRDAQAHIARSRDEAAPPPMTSDPPPTDTEQRSRVIPSRSFKVAPADAPPPGDGTRTMAAVEHIVAAAQDATPPRAGADVEVDADVVKTRSKVVNVMLFQRLITIFSAVLDAAAMSNNWVLVDRTNGSGSSTAELLLELAMYQTTQRPVIIVIDSIERLERFTSDAAADQVGRLKALAAQAQPFGTDARGPRRSFDMAATATEFEDWERFVDLPLPCEPQAAHVRDPQAPDLGVSPKRKWMYHYTQRIFASGTHYVFLGSDDDVFPVDALGPVGSVCAHGGSAAYRRLRGKIQSGQPLVMLYNTGGVTQAFASIHRALQQGKTNSRDIVPALEVVSKENWAANFGIPEIMMMQELAQRAPLLFRKTIVAVDLVVDTAEDVLSTLTGCFASIDGGIPELGLGSAQTSAVLNAWIRYLTLRRSATMFRSRADVLYWCLLTLNVLTAGFSVLYASWHIYGSKPMKRSDMRQIIVILPVVSAFVSTTRTRLRNVDKASICDGAAALIQSEIYSFRARIGKYDASTAKGSDAEKAGRAPRTVFVEEIQRLFGYVMDSDVGSSGALTFSKTGECARLVPEQGLKSPFYTALRNHVAAHEMTIKLPRVDPAAGDDRGRHLFDVVEPDDLVTPISIESYVHFRARPTAAYLELLAPRVSLWLSSLEMASNFVTSGGAVLALANRGELVSFTVAVAVGINNVIEYYALRPQLDAANSGIRDVQNMLTWFSSQSLVDRRTRQSKSHAVAVVEQAIVGLTMARCGTDALALQGALETPTGDEEGAEGKKEKEGKSPT